MATARKEGAKRKTKGTPQWVIIVSAIVLILLVIGVIRGYKTYRDIYKSNVRLTKEKKEAHLYIPTGASFDLIVETLLKEKIIEDSGSFVWLAKKKGYDRNIHPGHYRVPNHTSNKDLINMLRTGRQTPVRVMFHNIRTKEQLAGKIASQIEADSASLAEVFNDELYLKGLGLTRESIPAIFIPNTYEFYWNTTARQFTERMYKEYKKFWTEERKDKARAIGLSELEVSTLASIIDEEALMRSEEPIIAGVYMNRLHKGMRLQACPTVRFAMNDFTIKRVLKKHIEFESPYNTYRHDGLPPGPIAIPSVSALDAVLNYDHHSYLYFCAKDDFSGYHYFSKTNEQHQQYARLYQKALNKKKIMR